MYGYVYKFTFLPNNKIYIGKKKNLKDSDELDENYWVSGKIWKWKLSHYSKDEWPILIKREILEWCNSDEELCEREKYWIGYYDSTNKSIGYNISTGGKNPILFGSSNGMWNHQWTDEEKLNQINGLKNRDFWDDNNPARDPKVRDKISKSSKNNGCRMTTEGRRRISEFVSSVIRITNGKCNLQCKPEELNYYNSLGYDIGFTPGIRSKRNPNFIRITNGEVNHKIPREELSRWLSKGWIRGDRRKVSSQRKLKEI